MQCPSSSVGPVWLLGRCCQGCNTVGISAVPTCFLGCWRWGAPKGSIRDIPAAPQRVCQSSWERSSSPALSCVSALLEGWAQGHLQPLGYVRGNSEIIQGALGQLMPGQHCHSGTSYYLSSPCAVLQDCTLWSQVFQWEGNTQGHFLGYSVTLSEQSPPMEQTKSWTGDLICRVCRTNPMSS